MKNEKLVQPKIVESHITLINSSEEDAEAEKTKEIMKLAATFV